MAQERRVAVILSPLTTRTAADARDRRRSILLVLPAVAVTVVVVGGGIGATLLQSVGLMPLVGETAFTIEPFTSQGPDILQAAGVSVGIAAASTVIAAAVGLLAALVIVSGRLGAKLVAALGAATVTVPHLVGAAAIGLLLADAGVLPRLLGIPPEEWPAIVGGPWWVAVIAEFAWKEAAFIGLVVTGTLATRVARFDETAALLGAGRWKRFRYVFLPLTAPTLIICSAISFVYALGSYEVAWLLGRTYPEPLPVMAIRLFQGVSLTSRPDAAAAAIVTTVIALLVVAATFLVLRRSAIWR